MCSAASSSTARRSVPIETPIAVAISVSLGSVSPGGQVPDSIALSSERLTTRYSGMPAASGAMASNTGADADAVDTGGIAKKYTFVSTE